MSNMDKPKTSFKDCLLMAIYIFVRFWPAIAIFIVIFILFFFIGRTNGCVWMGVLFPFGWTFPGLCREVVQTPFGCRVHHEGKCAGVISCLQMDVDNCVHSCEIGIFTIKGDKREDSQDPPWTVPIQEIECGGCWKKIPYSGQYDGSGYCWDCLDQYDPAMNTEKEEE